MVTDELVTMIRDQAREEQKARRAPKRKGGGRRWIPPSLEDLKAEAKAKGITI